MPIPTHSFKEFIEIRNMSVKGGDLDGEYKIDVVLGYDGVDRKTLIDWNSQGSSRRVVLQDTLRNHTKEHVVEMLEKSGLAVHARNVKVPFKTPEDERKEALAALMALPEEQRNQALKEAGII